MTGSEMHTMLRRTGIKGTELASQMGFPTASRVYKASNSGSSEVQTIFDMAFERILGKGRFDALLKRIREDRIALRAKSAKVVVVNLAQSQPKKRVLKHVNSEGENSNASYDAENRDNDDAENLDEDDAENLDEDDAENLDEDDAGNEEVDDAGNEEKGDAENDDKENSGSKENTLEIAMGTDQQVDN